MSGPSVPVNVRRADNGRLDRWYLSPGMVDGAECLVCASSDPFARMQVVARVAGTGVEVVAHVPCVAELRAEGFEA